MKWAKDRFRSYRTRVSRKQLRWSLSELEARMMLAGDAGPAVAACLATPQSPVSVPETCSSHSAVVTSLAAEHLVILDAAVASQSAWAEAVPQDASLVILSSDGDPIQEISHILSQHSGLKSVHLFCHGNDGVLQVGGSQLTETTIAEHEGKVRNWGKAFAEGGDFLIYGCDVASGSKGVRFVSTLADRIGVDVAASTDRTGSARFGGDWELELAVGNIESAQVLSREHLDQYQGYLGIDIWAAGQTAQERMELQIGSQVVASWLLDNTDANADQFRLFQYDQDGVAPDDIRINFVNDFYDETNGIDYNLRVDRIVVDGVTYQTEDPSVFADGVYVDALQIITSGNLQSEYLHTNGYFQYAGPAQSTGMSTDSLSGMQLNGSAAYEGEVLQLTGTKTRQAGTAFNTTPISVNESTSFQSSFAFRIGGGSGAAGADGMTFLIQGSPQGVDALGRAGGYLGYDTISKSLAIEFDTYRNAGDASANGIAVVVNGQTRNAIAETESPLVLNNDQLYFAWVDYDGGTDSLSVYLSQTDSKPAAAILETQVALDQVVGDSAFVGFSAGNFDQPNYHHVLLWSFATDAPPAGNSPGEFSLASSQITIGEDQGTIAMEVRRSGGSTGAASIDFATLGNSAVAGQDFQENSGRLNFADGQTTATIVLNILDDSDPESLEQFSVRLENPINAGLRSPQSTLVNIVDDDLGLPDFASFSSSNGLNLNGSASIVDGQLQLTGTGVRQAGSAFFEAPLAINSSTSFQSAFSFNIGGGSGTTGADGMTFLLQNSPNGTDAIGRAGGYLGYDTISNSLAIEFDTYKNGGDLAGNTIAVVINGDTRNAIAEVEAPFDLNSGARYTAWVDYDGETNTLAVYLSESAVKPNDAVLRTQVALDQILGNTAYAGFSAGNFDQPNYHRVSSWSLSLDAAPSSGASAGSFSLVTSQITAVEGQGSITLEVRRVGGSQGAASIDYLTAGNDAVSGEDFVEKSGRLLFGDGEVSKTFTIDLVDDDIAESSEQFSVRVDNPIGADLLAPGRPWSRSWTTTQDYLATRPSHRLRV